MTILQAVVQVGRLTQWVVCLQTFKLKSMRNIFKIRKLAKFGPNFYRLANFEGLFYRLANSALQDFTDY